MPEGNAYPTGHLVPSPIVGLACAPIVENRFLELAMSLLDFSPRIPLGTFSILLIPHPRTNRVNLPFIGSLSVKSHDGSWYKGKSIIWLSYYYSMHCDQDISAFDPKIKKVHTE